jgi:hypothetical protein
MHLKFMDGEEGYRFVQVTECAFRRHPEPAVIYRKDGESKETAVTVAWPVFVINEMGITIEAFYPQPRGRRQS